MLITFIAGTLNETYKAGNRIGEMCAKFENVSNALADEIKENKIVHPITMKHETIIPKMEVDIADIKKDVRQILMAVRTK